MFFNPEGTEKASNFELPIRKSERFVLFRIPPVIISTSGENNKNQFFSGIAFVFNFQPDSLKTHFLRVIFIDGDHLVILKPNPESKAVQETFRVSFNHLSGIKTKFLASR